MREVRLALSIGVLALVVSGCTLWSPERSGRHGERASLDDSQATSGARIAHGRWRHEVRARASSSRVHYYNLPVSVVWARLELAAVRYGFMVDRVHFIRLQPGQVAPEVFVRTAMPQRLARAVPAIMKSIDPLSRVALPNGTHARFEGFWLEAKDARGVPFLAVYNFWRGEGPGGGQWARSEALFPYPHG